MRTWIWLSLLAVTACVDNPHAIPEANRTERQKEVRHLKVGPVMTETPKMSAMLDRARGNPHVRTRWTYHKPFAPVQRSLSTWGDTLTEAVAHIYEATSTVDLPTGSTHGWVRAKTRYRGGLASNNLSIQTRDLDGRYSIPNRSIPHQGIGTAVYGTLVQWQLNTSVPVDVPRHCQIELSVSTTHRAWWPAPAPFNSMGDDFATSYDWNRNGTCPPPPPPEYPDDGGGCGGDTDTKIDDRDTQDEEGGDWTEDDWGWYGSASVGSVFVSDCVGDGSDGSTDGSGGLTCRQEWVIVEISYDGGRTWSTLWEGYATVCEG